MTTLQDRDSREGSADSLLAERLAAVLPQGYRFNIHHLSTPPFRTDSLCSAPPDARPDRTYCENHFLAVSIDTEHSGHLSQPLPASSLFPRHDDGDVAASGEQVLVLALEVFIFTTAYSSTFFVSKADSTGYLHLLGLPPGTPSPIREVSAAFLSYLVEHRRRINVQSVVSLFARAQAQYLFPGSVENSGKHVLDDRGLVRWWCRVLNPLLNSSQGKLSTSSGRKSSWGNITAYLVIPGLDTYEARAFLPRTPSAASKWVLGHPLERISHFVTEYDWVPPRCLIPRYPDDPKSRFRDELDAEASHWTEYREKGSWRSVKTLEQFWEMMAFRQECSGGHMTGFIWVVFDPPGTATAPSHPPLLTPSTSFNGSQQSSMPSTPPKRRAAPASLTPKSSPLKQGAAADSLECSPLKQSPANLAASRAKKKRKLVLKGPIHARQPRVKTHAKNYLPDIPTSTAYYTWPAEGRGTRIVAETDYKRSVELLLRLDFANLHLAVGSTKRWISEVGGGMRWGLDVVGRRSLVAARLAASTGRTEVNNMTNLVRKKRPADSELGEATSGTISGDLNREQGNTKLTTELEQLGSASAASSTVNVLSANLVRKKRKEPDEGKFLDEQNEAQKLAGDSTIGGMGQQVNVLGAGLVRKKPKAS